MVDTVRLWYMNLAATDVQAISVFCWAVVALAMATIIVLLVRDK